MKREEEETKGTPCDGAGSAGPIVWTPSAESVRVSQMATFARLIECTTGTNPMTKSDSSVGGYDGLYNWSVENISEFWGLAWKYLGIQSSKPYTEVVDDASKMPGAKWFAGARLNFAQNLLRFRDDRTALVFRTDCSTSDVRVTYRELYDRVAVLARALRSAGVTRGDRVGGVLPNMPEAIVAMLATTSIGALWSSCSPDFGLPGVRDRFGQIKPKVVFISDGYFYKGKRIDSMSKLADIVSLLPSVERVVVVRYTVPASIRLNISAVRHGVHYDEFVKASSDAARPDDEIKFEQLPFDHPVYIMYSSGTTGLPKCIVQGAGVLLNHLKELVLHCNCSRSDTLYYFSTTGWMMWNWLVSGLATGCTVVLFDGNPLYPTPGALFEMAQDLKITLFGASARYLQAVEDGGCVPAREYDLSCLRTIMSTGSPSTVNTFNFVYNKIKPDVQFASISGGTDLNGCFALGCPIAPVRRPELQCRGLGMKVKIYNDEGRPVVGEKGELVCEAAFPSMPLFFWGDEDGSRYHNAYFGVYDGIWRHGDFAMLSSAGGMIIYGRSDATLNPGGVRIGTAELYRVLDTVPELADSVVIGKSTPAGDVKIVLFVKLQAGGTLTEELKVTLRRRLRAEVSPRHVPAVILVCPDIPYTLSGKKVELAVKKLLEGRKVMNRDALKNPESLDFYASLAGREL